MAGTDPTDWRDLLDDAQLPFHRVKKTRRYMDARYMFHTSPIRPTRVVGHSLGGAVANQLRKDEGVDYELYNAPVWGGRKSERGHHHRHRLDPVSMFDRWADSEGFITMNPHGYAGLARKRGRFQKP